jgi:hypothetical protein
MLVPVVRDQRVLGLVELAFPAHVSIENLQAHLQLVMRFAGLIGQWIANKSIKSIQRRGDMLTQLDQFAKEVHSSIDVRETCYTIANEVRLMLKCDRASVFTLRGKKCHLAAVSGQATIDHRASLVVALSELVQAICISGDTLLYEGTPLDLPPQVEDLLEHYLDESFAKGLLIVPLKSTVGDDSQQTSAFLSDSSTNQSAPVTLGALVVEQLESELPIAELQQQGEPLLDHVRLALANSVQHSTTPLLPVLNLVRRSHAAVGGQNLPRTMGIGGFLLLAALILGFWPAELKIRAGGSLQPVERRDMFVDVSGIVKKVHVAHGDHVQVGDVLAELENSDLEVQRAEIIGQLHAAEQQALAAEKKMVDDSLLDSAERHRLASERLALIRRVESLKQQYKLLEAKHEHLTIRSTSAGSVVTWDTEDQLLNKPLSQGEVLMSVANLEGPWELDLFMPERRIGHVAHARHHSDEPLPVDFILRTNPSETISGNVKEIHASAELQETEGLGVRIKIDFDEQAVKDLYPGAAVAAEVHCGRYPLGYVWFHEVFEWIYTHIFF